MKQRLNGFYLGCWSCMIQYMMTLHKVQDCPSWFPRSFTTPKLNEFCLGLLYKIVFLLLLLLCWLQLLLLPYFGGMFHYVDLFCLIFDDIVCPVEYSIYWKADRYTEKQFISNFRFKMSRLYTAYTGLLIQLKMIQTR